MSTRQILKITNLNIPVNKILDGNDLTAAMNTAAVIARSLLNIESTPTDLLLGDTIVKKGTMLGNHFKLSQIEAGLQSLRDQLAPSIMVCAETHWNANYLRVTSKSDDPEDLKFEVISIAATNLLNNIELFNENGLAYSGSTYVKKAMANVYGSAYRSYEKKNFDAINNAISEIAMKLELSPDEVTDEQILEFLRKRGATQLSTPEGIGAYRREYFDERAAVSLSYTLESGESVLDRMSNSKDFVQDMIEQIEFEEAMESSAPSLIDKFSGTELALFVAFRINKDKPIFPYFTDGDKIATDQLFKAVVKGDKKYRDRLIDKDDNINVGELLKVRNNMLQRTRSIISKATEMGPDRGIGLDKWLKECSNREAEAFHSKAQVLLPMIMRDLEDFEDYLQDVELDNYTPQPYDKSYIARRSI